MAVQPLPVPPLRAGRPVPSGRVRLQRAAAAAAVAAGLVVGATTVAGLPEEEARLTVPPAVPVAGPEVAVTPAVAPGAAFRVPEDYRLSVDQDALATLKTSRMTDPLLVVMRVGRYPGAAPGQDLAGSVAADPRLVVLDRRATTLDGQPATRFVVEARPGQRAEDWFCPDGPQACSTLDPTGDSTLYVTTRDGADVLLQAGSHLPGPAAEAGPLVDRVAATWRWRG